MFKLKKLLRFLLPPYRRKIFRLVPLYLRFFRRLCILIHTFCINPPPPALSPAFAANNPRCIVSDLPKKAPGGRIILNIYLLTVNIYRSIIPTVSGISDRLSSI